MMKRILEHTLSKIVEERSRYELVKKYLLILIQSEVVAKSWPHDLLDHQGKMWTIGSYLEAKFMSSINR